MNGRVTVRRSRKIYYFVDLGRMDACVFWGVWSMYKEVGGWVMYGLDRIFVCAVVS